MREKASQLGKQLDPPRLSRKFSWLRRLVGWGLATRAQLFIPQIKWSLVSFWDKVLFHIEKREQDEEWEGEMASKAKDHLRSAPQEIASR
jgi:hypothetical protein